MEKKARRKLQIHCKKIRVEGMHSEWEARGFIDGTITPLQLTQYMEGLMQEAKGHPGIPGFVRIDEGEFKFDLFSDPYQVIGFITVHMSHNERERLKNIVFRVAPDKLAGDEPVEISTEEIQE